MTIRQAELTRATYQLPWGEASIGIVRLNNGYSVVTACGLRDMLGYHTAGHQVTEWRIVNCTGGARLGTQYRRRQVFGIRGIRDALDRGCHQLTMKECDDLVAWFEQQGVSDSLWPDEEAPVPMRPSSSREASRRNEKLASSLDRLVLVDGGNQGGRSGSPFDSIREFDEHGLEFWSARLLQGPLGYIEFRNFQDAIERAKISCEMAGHPVSDHFTASTKTVVVGSGASRELDDVRLSRYGAYLVAMNGDPRKPEIAAAQQYFIVRTRQAETQSASSENLTQILGVMMEQIRTTREHAVALVDHERRIVEAADKAEKALAEIQRMQEARPVFEGVYTIQEFARHLGCPLQSARKIKDRQELGEFLSEICRDRDVKGFIEGYRTTELGHSVNGYPVEILREFKNHFVDFEGTRPERAVVIPRLKKFISDQKPTAFDFPRRSN